jgi:UPF0042 nucleotide-binding protein
VNFKLEEYMEFVIVTGLSGAGKSRAIDALEDIGFFCVDNLPPTLIPVFYELCEKAEGMTRKIAVVSDTRGGEFFKSFSDCIENMKNQKKKYKILFLDASDSVLVNRYQETRRKHPLAERFNGSVEDAVSTERKLLLPIREMADYIIDTSSMRPQAMKERITKIFLDNDEGIMAIHCMSFGYKHGIPLESDLVFDVRCLPNPFYVEELRNLTGLDKPVKDFIFGQPETDEFLNRFIGLIDYLIPLYKKEGKSQLVISIGCTGGHHRSVAIAEYLYEHLSANKQRVTISHRDISI